MSFCELVLGFLELALLISCYSIFSSKESRSSLVWFDNTDTQITCSWTLHPTIKWEAVKSWRKAATYHESWGPRFWKEVIPAEIPLDVTGLTGARKKEFRVQIPGFQSLGCINDLKVSLCVLMNESLVFLLPKGWNCWKINRQNLLLKLAELQCKLNSQPQRGLLLKSGHWMRKNNNNNNNWILKVSMDMCERPWWSWETLNC